MTQPIDIRRVPDTFRTFRVLDGCCCIGGGTEGYRRAFGPHCRIDGWAKGIDWSTDHLKLREALPPAYTEWIGRAYLTTLAPALEVAA
ncbi:hypothetical protein POF73_20185 [Streptomyces sp. HD]|nr:hypothetical protein [Streptomyces sp. HD]MDC0769188.1 hypothetical protein [Streptomyces sp. HD]